MLCTIIALETLFSRFMGLIFVIPSLMMNLAVGNALARSYKGRNLQKILGLCFFVACAVDAAFISAHLQYFASGGTWQGWGPVTVAFNVVKRVNSGVIIYTLCLRASAVIPALKQIPKVWTKVFTAVYLAIGLAGSACHIYSYTAGNWVSSVAYANPVYPVYRVLDLVAVSLYMLLAVITDIQFLMIGHQNHHSQRQFVSARLFYNPFLYVLLEVGIVIIVIAQLAAGISNTLYGSAPYNEAFLLAIVWYNSTLLVQLLSSRAAGGNLLTEGTNGVSGVSSPSSKGNPRSNGTTSTAVGSSLAKNNLLSLSNNARQVKK
ncbi:hypothetical protein BC828DRAFT_275417 [Blastocladiella britannica]|nr:hypothetical protein BC828DRAFT_275417 [Blastocladiella britannica]